ncbi:hypothetical protein BX600DRAFT_525981 [Xylariales sp. PMI_506]|nr:hypothetical protein BX600DRAFT_525981 [Xylariales sp. PMI_506]
MEVSMSPQYRPPAVDMHGGKLPEHTLWFAAGSRNSTEFFATGTPISIATTLQYGGKFFVPVDDGLASLRANDKRLRNVGASTRHRKRKRKQHFLAQTCKENERLKKENDCIKKAH